MRAFIVDDAPLLSVILAEQLLALGESVVGGAADATTGALDVAVLAPDVIFLDGRIQGGASAAVTALRAAAPGAAVVAVVALSEVALAQRALAAGASEVLLRPYLRSRLAAVLEALRTRPR